MANIVITTQPQSVTVAPGQNTTFTVVGSADFSSPAYNYQWKRGGTSILGATSSSYMIDPVLGDSGSLFSVSVSALSGATPLASVNSSNATLTVQAATGSIYDKFYVGGKESGQERHRRLRHLGNL
jgi:hypothetical protein